MILRSVAVATLLAFAIHAQEKVELKDAKQKGHRLVVLVGDEPYYTKVGFSRLPPGRVKFPGPVDQNRILGLSLKAGELLTLSGQVRRAQIDDPVCAGGAGVG